MNLRTSTILAILGIALICKLCAAQEIHVAAAADLQSAMQDLAVRFEWETGKKVTVIFGSSGNFFQQIQQGAPFDMFFSANLDYPKKLEAAGLAENGSYYQYARGKIVVWVPKECKINLFSGLKVLLDPSVKKIAIANPLHLPFALLRQRPAHTERVADWRWLCSSRSERKENSHRQSATRSVWAGRCLSNAKGRCLRQSKGQVRSGREYLANRFIHRLGLS